jgi:cyclopropane fatty-acyl-phospholipid synthase-like methyltransferase
MDHAHKECQNTTNTQFWPFFNVIDRNTIVFWILIVLSALLSVLLNPWFCLLFIVLIFIDDLLLYGFGKALLFDSQARVARFYQWAHGMYDNTTGSNRDLGFNLVVNNELSQLAKYEYMVKQLKLEKDMKICDIGCGYGDWLKYCRDVVGCEVVGINLTPEQAMYAKDVYGLTVYITNWKNILKEPALQKQLYNQFDCVTFMDTIEHYVSMEDRKNIKKQLEIYSDVCILAKNLIHKNSSSRRIFMSCLHQKKMDWKWIDYLHGYLVDKTYSGYYPFIELSPASLSRNFGFKIVEMLDKTEDYRITAVRDRKHFQAVKINWTASKVFFLFCFSLLDPFVLHRMAYFYMDSWMHFYGEDAYSEKYDAEYRKKVSYVSLQWTTLEMQHDGSNNVFE